MMIIEALKELRTIKKRIASNMDEIEKYASRLSTEATYFPNDHEQRREVQQRIQACEDLVTRYLALRQDIMLTNLSVRVAFEKKVYSVHDLLDLRREIGSLLRSVYLALNDKHAEARRIQMRGSSEPMSIVRLYDERDKNQKLRVWEDFLADIDGRLEIINATTPLLSSGAPPPPSTTAPPETREAQTLPVTSDNALDAGQSPETLV